MKVYLGPSSIDPARAAFYRAEYFSRNYYLLEHSVLRGKSEWSKSDRELFAAHTSKANDCEFCIVVHSAFASSRARNPTWIENIIDDKKTDGQSEELTEALKFIKKLTQQSWNIDESDIQRLVWPTLVMRGLKMLLRHQSFLAWAIVWLMDWALKSNLQRL